MQVTEWIEETKRNLERRGGRILSDSELDKIVSWQATGWIADNYKAMADIADIQLAFATMLLHHAFAVREQRDQLEVILHRLNGEGK